MLRIDPRRDAGSADSGLILLACVHAADLPARTGARMLSSTADHGSLSHLELVWADAAHAGAFASQLRAERGWHLDMPRHPDRQLWRYGFKEKPRERLSCPAEKPPRPAGRGTLGEGQIIGLLTDDGGWTEPAATSR